MSVLETRKRQLDLARLHEECEFNYQRLHRVVPEALALGARFDLHYRDQPDSGIRLEVIEVTKYTSTVLIVADRAGPHWLPKIEIKVRVYRDAKMAEVVEWCSDRTIPWALSENKGMQSRDEKLQWNMFLSELLAFGLRSGLVGADA
jgi:uncharacterized protein YqiB (DUF1249 family)